jgi:hypothetical protein
MIHIFSAEASGLVTMFAPKGQPYDSPGRRPGIQRAHNSPVHPAPAAPDGRGPGGGLLAAVSQGYREAALSGLAQ